MEESSLHENGEAVMLALLSDLRTIAESASTAMKAAAADHAEFLYDDRDLPK